MKILLVAEKSSICKLISETVKKYENQLPKENNYSLGKRVGNPR